MAMSDYLPPIVTELKADLSDLAAGFAAAKKLADEYAREVPDTLREAFRSAGRDSAAGFTAEFEKGTEAFRDSVNVSMRDTARRSSETFWDETDRSWRGSGATKAAKAAASVGLKAGTAMGESLATTITSASSPGMLFAIGAALAASIFIVPAIGAAIGAALTVGIGAGFIGLAAILLKDQPRVVWMAGNLGRTVKNVFTKAALPLTETFVHAIVLFENMILRLAPKIQKAFGMMQPAITPLVEGIIGMIENMGPGIESVLDVAWRLISQIGQELPAFGTALSGFLDGIATGGPGMARFISDVFMLASTYLPMLGEALGWLSMRYLDVAMALSSFQQWLVKTKTDVTEWGKGVGEWFVSAWHAVEDFATGAYDAVAEWALGVGAWFNEVYAAIGTWIDNAVAYVSSLPARFMAGLRALPGVIRSAIIAAFDFITYYAGFIITNVVKFFAITLPAGVGAGILWVVDKIRQGWDAAVAWTAALPARIVLFFAQLWLDITAWWTRTSDDVSATAEALPGRLAAFFAQLWADVTAWVARTYASVVAWFDALPGRITTALNNLKASVMNWAVSTGSMLYSAGKDLVQGFVNGIQDKLSDAVGAVKRAVSNFAQGARDALGIRSPSTVFAKMGGQSADGFGLGWVARMKNVTAMIGRSIAPAGTGQTYREGGFSAGMSAATGGGTALGAATPVILQLDGKTIATALIPHAQRGKTRNLTTGLA